MLEPLIHFGGSIGFCYLTDMRRILIFSLFACCFCLNGFSQNWEAFTSGRTYHYKSDTAIALPDQSIHFDSIQVLGADTAFSVARRFVFPVDTSQRNMPMFIGRELRALSDGTFNFLSPHNLAIPTRAGMGSSFTLDSISGLTAAVTQMYQRPVLGLTLDSVKVFTTLALDSLVLSKSHGILEWPASLGGARFRLAGIQELHLGDTLPGFDGIFDLPQGADFYYTSLRFVQDIGTQENRFRVKFHVDTAQRVLGGVQVDWSGIVLDSLWLSGNFANVSTTNTSGSFLIENRPRNILTKSHHEQVRAPGMMAGFGMPQPWATYIFTGALDSLDPAWQGHWTTMTHQRNGNFNEVHLGRSNGAVGWLYSGIGGDTCVASHVEQMRAVFRQGFGVTHVEWAGFESYGEFNLVGSIINGDTVGTIFPDGALLSAQNELDSQLKIAVYPNPANAELYVQWIENRAGSVILTDLTGKVVKSQDVHGIGATLDVQNLPAGMYLLKLTQGNLQTTQRVVIAH